MKTSNRFLVALLSAGLLASCAKDVHQETPVANRDKHVVISLGGVQSKAADPVELLSTTPDVDNIAIFVTNSAGTILKKVEVDKDVTPDSDWDRLTDEGLLIPNVGTEATSLSIYGNYKKGADTYVTGEVGDAITVATTYDQQQGSKVLYTGTEALTAFSVSVENVNDENVYTFTGSVTIKPAVARIQIKQFSFVENGSETVTNNSNGEQALVEWTGLTGELLGVYFNNFYKEYDGSAVAASLMTNTSAFGRVTDGKWLFGADASETDEAEYASYNQWNGGSYTAYDLDEFNTPAIPADKKSFAFNFFPGQTPYVHFNLGNVTATDITSDNENAYNPRLLPLSKYVNVVNFTNASGDVTFEAGKIYNVSIEVKPQFMHTDLNTVVYNISLTVTIADWTEEDIDPGFQQQ
ncbi:MAG: hypothetical protein LIO68_08350 [Rikenellaceae bacterium]|nr:hypothetical protein [Rikenellaceae bacterium]